MKILNIALLAAVVSQVFAVTSGFAGQKYNELQDAAVAQATVWQKGGRAHPIMSSDGKIVFAFGQSMPKLTCSPTRACDVEMQPSEKVKKVILGDGVNWSWNAAESVENGKTIQHVVFQPKDKDVESNVIITTDRRTYHIRLFAPKQEGAYLNRVGFYYPEELVQEWEAKAGASKEEHDKAEKTRVMSKPVSIDKLDFDYQVDGDAAFKPLHVFNDGGRVYMEMPPGILNEESPVLVLIGDDDKALVVNYRVENDPSSHKVHYVVDKLFTKGELRLGAEKVGIVWKKREKKGFWNSMLGGGAS